MTDDDRVRYAKDLFFGPEPPGDDPFPTHTDAVRSCRAAVAGVCRATQVAVAASPATMHLAESLQGVEAGAASPSALPMRVVLMGRTMAGKSTLFAALTDGSRDRVGVGAQRTSRDVVAASAAELPCVEIVDTPGVGAKDGAEDVKLAMGEIPRADLVVWVASNDSFQEETAQALRAVAYYGKPIVVALNCRAQLVDSLDRDDFLEAPDSAFEQHEGHFRSIRTHLISQGVLPVAEVMLHAEAALQARTDDALGVDLRAASRVDDLLGVLAQESGDRRIARRTLREADEVRAEALAVSGAIAHVEEQVRVSTRLARGLREDQERRIRHLIDGCQQRMEDDVVRILGARHGWHQTITDFGSEVAEKWGAEQEAVVGEVEASLSALADQLSRDVSSVSAEAAHEWATVNSAPDVQIDGVRGFAGTWKHHAAGVVVGAGGSLVAALVGAKAGAVLGAQLGGAGGLAIGGVGAIPGAAVGIVVGAITGAVTGLVGTYVVTPLRRAIQSLFTSEAKILQANQELLKTRIGDILSELESHFLTVVADLVTSVELNVETALSRKRESEMAADAVAESLAGQNRSIATALSELDHATITALLQSDGRPRLAASVTRATRLAGVCAAVEVADEGLAEAWLCPPSLPESLAFGRTPSAGLPGDYAAAYVLGFSGEVPSSIQSRRGATTVVTDAPVPDQVLGAWSAAVSEHLGAPIKIRGTARARRASA